MERVSTFFKYDGGWGSPTVNYKITIEIKENKLTSDELKQASRYLSEVLAKMGIDHTIECHMDKLKLFRITKNFLLKQEL